jgi:restriction endonuclease S subunit
MEIVINSDDEDCQNNAHKYYCKLCNKGSDQKSHHLTHTKSKKHKQEMKIKKLRLEKEDIDNLIEWYGTNDIDEILQNLEGILKKEYLNKKKIKTNKVIFKLSKEEAQKFIWSENFKIEFVAFMNKMHNILRGCAVTGEAALNDILYSLFLCYLEDKRQEGGIFEFSNIENYNGISEKRIKEYSSYLNLDYILNNTDRLRPKDGKGIIEYCGELLSKHNNLKDLIKDKNFINCSDPIILSSLLKNCKEFSDKFKIFETPDLIGLAYEYFTSRNGNGNKEMGQYFTERPLMRMCFELIDKKDLKKLGINNDSTIGDEFCATFGFPISLRNFLKNKLNIQIKDDNIYGVEYHQKLSRYAILNAVFSMKQFDKVVKGDSFITNVSPHLDISVHNVPFGKSMKYKNIKKNYEKYKKLPDFNQVIPISKNGDAMLASQLVLYKTKKMGLLIIKDGEETSSRNNMKFRKYFCQNCVIKKIMKIPSGIFTSTGTKTVCIYFIKKEGQQTKNIQFLELNDKCDTITEICKVSIKELKINNYSWDPNVYIIDEEFQKLISKTKTEFKMLGEVTNIDYGTRITKKNANSDGNYKVYGGGGETFTTDTYNRDGYTCKISRFAASIHNCILLLNEKYYLNDSGLTIESNDEKLLNQYLWFYLYYKIKNNKKLFKKIYRGSGQQNIDLNELNKIYIPIPSIEKQNDIIIKLTDLNEQIELLEKRKEGINRQIKYTFENFVQKEETEIKTLEDIIDINIGSTPSTKESEYWNGDHKWISVSELNNNTIPIIDSKKKLTDKAIKKCKPRLVKKGSVLMSFKLSIGKLGIAGADLYTNEAIIQMDTSDPFLNKWLYYYFFTFPPKGASGSIGQGNLNKEKLKKLDVILIKNKQNEIIKYLDKLEEKKNSIDQEILDIDNTMKHILEESYL